MKLKLKLGKRGISPLIATIILIGICVAGGLLIYNLFFSTTGTITQRGQVEVVTVDLVKSSGGTTFSITIKNTGNKPVTELNVTLEGQDDPFEIIKEDSVPLSPGQTKSYQESNLTMDSNDGDYVVGKDYLITISAKFSDGSEFKDAIKVTCE